MDITGSLVQAAQLMLIGMLVVFVFLITLVFVTKLLAKVAGKEPERTHNTWSANGSTAAIKQPTQGGINPSVVAAITAAVHRYRNK